VKREDLPAATRLPYTVGVSRSQQILGSAALWTLIVLASALVPYALIGLNPHEETLGTAFVI
jgi:hypothetical protein